MDLGCKKKPYMIFSSAGLFLIMILAALMLTEISASSTTTVYVHPSSTVVLVGDTFVVEIRISDVSDLYGWEFKLSWDPNLLEAENVTEGEFLKRGGPTFFVEKINNTEGNMLVYCTLLGDVSGVSGDGTLASVTFYAEKKGSSVLDLSDTVLIDSSEQSILHTINDGSVTISSPVGGIRIPAEKFTLLAPWIGTGLIFSIVTVIIVVFIKRRKKGCGFTPQERAAKGRS
jgi:hypothetical protein